MAQDKGHPQGSVWLLSRGLLTGENKIGTSLCIPSAGRSWKRQHLKASARCLDLQNTPKNICIPCLSVAHGLLTGSCPRAQHSLEAKHRTQPAPSMKSPGIARVAPWAPSPPHCPIKPAPIKQAPSRGRDARATTINNSVLAHPSKLFLPHHLHVLKCEVLVINARPHFGNL